MQPPRSFHLLFMASSFLQSFCIPHLPTFTKVKTCFLYKFAFISISFLCSTFQVERKISVSNSLCYSWSFASHESSRIFSLQFYRKCAVLKKMCNSKGNYVITKGCKKAKSRKIGIFSSEMKGETQPELELYEMVA